MKKKHLLLAAFAATMLAPTIAWAQYPQINDEAKENYKKMMTEERRLSDEAWEKDYNSILELTDQPSAVSYTHLTLPTNSLV